MPSVVTSLWFHSLSYRLFVVRPQHLRPPHQTTKSCQSSTMLIRAIVYAGYGLQPDDCGQLARISSYQYRLGYLLKAVTTFLRIMLIEEYGAPQHGETSIIWLVDTRPSSILMLDDAVWFDVLLYLIVPSYVRRQDHSNWYCRKASTCIKIITC